MALDRRTFLRQSAAATVFLGFGTLARTQGRADGAGEILEKARARMKRDRMVGIALYVPGKPEDRAALGRALEGMVGSNDVGVQEVLLEAVYFCVPPLLVDGRQVENVVLFDPDMRRIAGADLDYRTLVPDVGGKGKAPRPGSGFPVRLFEGVRELLHGEGRLEARAKASTTPELEAAIRTIDENASADPEAFRKADHYLSTNFDRCAAAIAFARAEAERNHRTTFLHSFIRQRYAVRLSAEGEWNLPYGVAWKTEPRPDPCPACGMAIVPPVTRTFLKFLLE
ncbi:MAG TPA: hypothetical protein VKF62_00895 [Planctomycetota bacterium]|nr:hypothetical protein [Planctomycetota bacterium]